jgi:hypothetical protein
MLGLFVVACLLGVAFSNHQFRLKRFQNGEPYYYASDGDPSDEISYPTYSTKFKSKIQQNFASDIWLDATIIKS